ncbi:Coproporphyrinogen III oxidase, aerobic [Rhodovulum sp. P5]|uniref:oxygen-dependent coproporphyrinogen oxidase n=1 Tax=Rhodovulum sp. P5 TaxID=1564506 RepID=UPI0009C2A3A3|nr:oxygen-dependent coproporphyrinogen oxidase [Rhodovulum sp. P5]ARE40169.1 Coproporphyrinogen III oxidase, aerobic [Rhodovulum sp. P5]
MTEMFDDRKAQASAWFQTLRDEIVAAFEALEDSQTTGPFADQPAGRFEVTETRRKSEDGSDAGGGVMSVMRGGRVFEKVGVNISTVHGRLNPQAQSAMMARKDMPGLAEDPRFWASGVSLVAHMQNPHTPAVHLNTRMFWTPHGWWFGGGTDLNPCLPRDEDTADFHAVLKTHCDRHDTSYYPRFKAWADEYFFVPHRGRARGVGGIFFDDHNTGDWDTDFAFVRDVGRAFLPAFLPITERRRDEAWTDDDRATLFAQRGLYAEFNLLYDRGIKFGLATGHDPDAILMSMPPLASWP